MAVQQVARSTVPYVAPSRKPRGSILDHATIVEGVQFLDGEGLVWSYNCIGMDVNEVDCSGFTGLTKRFDFPSSTDGAMFVVQGGMSCKPFGFDMDDPALRAAFEAREPEGVSTGLHDALFDDAVDITPAAAVTPIQAIGLLEAYGYLDYSGQPILHLGPGMVSQAAAQGAIKMENGLLSTMLGTPIAVAGGYETKTGDKLDAEQWAFVTGAVVLARGEVVLASQLDRATNDITVLFERLYVAGIDCLIGKVKVKVHS
jgi:hypothetical protein